MLEIDEIVSVAASDFAFTGAAVSYSLANGGLDFTVAVPEPPTALSMLFGSAALLGAHPTQD